MGNYLFGSCRTLFNTVLTATTLPPTTCFCVKELAKYTKYKKRQTRVKTKFFSFFSHLLKPNVCSRLPLSWLTKDWYSLKGPFPPLWDSKEDLSQLECWIVNTNATQANKPRWASLFRASESEWRQTTVSIFVSSIRKWMKWAWQLTLLKRSGRTPREACKAQWRTNRIYNFNWFYFCLYLQLSLPAFIKKGYGHRNWVGKLNREVGKAYFS